MCISALRNKAIRAVLTVYLMGLGHTTSAAVVLISESNVIRVFGLVTVENGEETIERRRFSAPSVPGDFDELVAIDISIGEYSAKGTAQQTSRISTTSISASGATTASTEMPLDTSIGSAVQDSNTTLSVIFEVETPQLFDLSGLVSSSKFDGLGNLFGQVDISLTSSVGFFDLSFRAQMPDLLGTETIPFHESGTLLPEIYTLSVSTVTGANSDRDDPVMSGATDFSVDLNLAPVQIPPADVPVAPVADANGPYVFCPQAQPWFLDGTGSVNPDEGLSEPGRPGDTIQEYAWDLDSDNAFNNAFGPQPDVTAFFTALGVGDYVIQLRVTDTTATSFPSSGLPDLSDTDSAQVSVKDAADSACMCVELNAMPEAGGIQLDWSDVGADHYNIYRATTSGGPYVLKHTTASVTYLDNDVVAGTTYYYVIREAALNGDELCQSNEASAAPGFNTVSVIIDVKPGSNENPINPRSKGVIPVAVLGTESFDATQVNAESVEFGPDGAQEAHGQGHVEDVDGDDVPDIVLHFKMQETGIQCGDTQATLTGKTFSGEEFTGTDSIRTVGCKPKKQHKKKHHKKHHHEHHDDDHKTR